MQEQVKEVLDVVEEGLRRAAIHVEQDFKQAEKNEKTKLQLGLLHAERLEKIRLGRFHDGRIDCIAGNGIISELGVGVEPFGETDDLSEDEDHRSKQQSITEEKEYKEYKSMRPIEALPIVVIKHYDANCQGSNSTVTAALADWAGRLASNKVDITFYLSSSLFVNNIYVIRLPMLL